MGESPEPLAFLLAFNAWRVPPRKQTVANAAKRKSLQRQDSNLQSRRFGISSRVGVRRFCRIQAADFICFTCRSRRTADEICVACERHCSQARAGCLWRRRWNISMCDRSLRPDGTKNHLLQLAEIRFLLGRHEQSRIVRHPFISATETLFPHPKDIDSRFRWQRCRACAAQKFFEFPISTHPGLSRYRKVKAWHKG